MLMAAARFVHDFATLLDAGIAQTIWILAVRLVIMIVVNTV